ncbi:Nuclear envelope morphology protein 1 [Umbelopsis nana]
MKLTHLIDEQQDASLKHDEAKTTGSKPDLQDSEDSLRRRMGGPNDDERNSGNARKSILANSSIPRTISLSSIPQTLNLSASSPSTLIHKSASKQRNLSHLGEAAESLLQAAPSPSRQQTTPPPKGERTSTPSIPHPLPLSYYRSKTLVLDLDETLIHSTSRGNGVPGASGRAHVIEVVVDKHACLYYVYKRPHVDYFLRKVSEWYKVVVFTASMSEYADPVIDWLDQENRLISKRYFRQSCTLRGGNYLKDLTLVEPDLAKVCIVDNSPMAYILNSENGIPIEGWISESGDEALLDLLPFLDALRFTEDYLD